MLFTGFSVGTSSESEEEIVFQRKNRKKKNVLKSPDVSLGKRKKKKRQEKQNDKEVKHQTKNTLCNYELCLFLFT